MKWTTILYHFIQLLAVCAGIYNYKRLVKPTKVLFWLFSCFGYLPLSTEFFGSLF